MMRISQIAPLMFLLLSADRPLPELLDSVGKEVQVFWNHFSAVSCTERVQQTKLGEKGKVLALNESSFDYLIFLNLHGEDLSVEESRVEKGETKKKKKLPLLVTSGFPTLQLIFHPYYQGSFEYEFGGEEFQNGRKLIRIVFRHMAGTRSTSALHLRGRDFPLDFHGEAWVDVESNAITRITAGLLAPIEDLRLRALDSDVLYAPVRFPDQTWWLPQTATIEVHTARQRWRNTHHFSDYKRFSIESESTITP
jgi:hypothetical protein